MRRRFTERNLAVSPDGDRVTREELESERTIFSHELIPVYGERLSYFIAGPPGCGKSTTAAQILYSAPSTISRQINQLEEEIKKEDSSNGEN